MIPCQNLFNIFEKNNLTFFTGVPDSTFKDWMKFLNDEHGNQLTNIIAVNECEAAAIASGYHLATKKLGVVYMQNAGFGKVVNPHTSLLSKEVYSIPCIYMIGWRGEPGKKDEPQHKMMGRITLSILDTLEIPYQILPDNLEQAEEIIKELKEKAEQKSSPVALIIKKDILEKYQAKKESKTDYEMNREKAIKTIIDNLDGDEAIISTTGKASRELFEHRLNNQEIPKDFYTVGSMGCASSIALGIAIQKPDKKVFVFDGDGAALMQMGSLATIGHYKPKNLCHIILDNNSHDSTGGQPTVSKTVNFKQIALNCGYENVEQVQTKEDLAESIIRTKNREGPNLIVVKINKGARKDLGRPTTTPIENKQEFMKSLENQDLLEGPTDYQTEEKTKQFKILLIHANSTLDTMIPPNLAIMNAFLKRAGIQTKLFDTTFYKTREKTGDDARVNTLQVKETNFEDLGINLNKTNMYDDFINTVKEYEPDLIGLSAVSLTYTLGIEFLKRLRKENILIPTIVGGVHATVTPNEVIKEDCVDYICVCEGEQALVELCNALRDNKDTTNIKNIWAKKNNQIFKNEIRLPIDINDLPFQDWSIFDKRRIYKPMGGKIRRVGTFELDRGCPFSCSYCSNHFWNTTYQGKYYRKKDIKKFIQEVKFMKEKYNLEYVYLASETFLASSDERFNEFVKLWKEEINLPFWCQTRPETVTEDRVRMLKDLGMHSIGIGLESGSPEIRRILNRHMTNGQIIKAFEIFIRLDVRAGVNNIIGIPGETRTNIFETIELNRIINAKNIMTHIFNAYQGTPLYEECVQKGYLSPGKAGGDYRQDYALNLPNLTKEDVLGLQRTFALYVKMPKDRWPEIQRAEKLDFEGNATFEKLKQEYTEKYLN